MTGIDWLIVAGLWGLMVVLALGTRRYTRSVSDFLAAGRTAGRYLITVSEGMAALGAITVVAFFEQFYQAGFSPRWWSLPGAGVLFILALSGWVLYRFRQSRALTMAQFFEMRYSRRFRIFAGLLAFLSGLINFGIFPAVEARFFVYFCGLPASVTIAGQAVPTFALVMVVLLGTALFFTFSGGQIAVLVTGFVQGTVATVVLLGCFIALVHRFHWDQIADTLLRSPAKASRINPFSATEVEGFDVYYFLIATFSIFYTYMSWLGTQGYNSSARNPHEARMGKLLGTWRTSVQEMLILFIPICALTFLQHPDFAASSEAAHNAIAAIPDVQIQHQMTVPIALRWMLPAGIMGGFCALMLLASISTQDAYLHSWGSIFLQDVVLPFWGRTISPRRHMLFLRLSICGVAVFALFFSLLFPQNDFIMMFFAITGAIYLGGAGAVVVGGLYWRRGSTIGAWGAMITCSCLSLIGITWRIADSDCPMDGQRILFITMVASIVMYVVLSLLCPARRGGVRPYLPGGPVSAPKTEPAPAESPPHAPRHDYRRGDRAVQYAFVTWIVLWLVVFVAGSIIALLIGVTDRTWLLFWRINLWLAFVLGVLTAIWFTVGGIYDLRDMFKTLRVAVRDDSDDGMVRTAEPQTPHPRGIHPKEKAAGDGRT
ncbi:MAG: sodium:solute symporter [Phycisphaerae bacterium]|nr:sodium:solute symporter [Phycisphaerae bacterium]